MINDSGRASTGELIFLIAKKLSWPLSVQAQEFIMSSILGDTQGLSNNLTGAETYRVMAEMVEQGVDRPQLEELRRQFGKMPREIYRYKATLIERTEFSSANRIACVTIPQKEINEFSPLYNPAPLIQGDILQISDVEVAIVFKQYDGGRVTGAIRTSAAIPIAAELAEHLGGGGHANASGFKVENGSTLDEIKSAALEKAEELLDKLHSGESS
jgi:phosphoesterase RecJ-like protein